MASPFAFGSDLQTFLLSPLTLSTLKCLFDTLLLSSDACVIKSLVRNALSLDIGRCKIFILLFLLPQIFYCPDFDCFETLITLADSSPSRLQSVCFLEFKALLTENLNYLDLLHLCH